MESTTAYSTLVCMNIQQAIVQYCTMVTMAQGGQLLIESAIRSANFHPRLGHGLIVSIAQYRLYSEAIQESDPGLSMEHSPIQLHYTVHTLLCLLQLGVIAKQSQSSLGSYSKKKSTKLQTVSEVFGPPPSPPPTSDLFRF